VKTNTNKVLKQQTMKTNKDLKKKQMSNKIDVKTKYVKKQGCEQGCKNKSLNTNKW
jgi:hypothetical protein